MLSVQPRRGFDSTVPDQGPQSDAGHSSRMSSRWLRWLAVLIAIASALIAVSLVTD